VKLNKLIEKATATSPWDVGNDVLYRLYRTRPLHIDVPDVIAKVWLIGRSYAAAIERRKNEAGENNDFYIDVVGPKIVASDLDEWISEAKQFTRRMCGLNSQHIHDRIFLLPLSYKKNQAMHTGQH
jgi:hypothetical protein